MFKKVLAAMIRAYQLFLSPDQGFLKSAMPVCRFYPSCSEYTRQAIAKYGAWAGIFKGIKRLSRCHPFNPGGGDPLV